jgi:hypothetical protein
MCKGDDVSTCVVIPVPNWCEEVSWEVFSISADVIITSLMQPYCFPVTGQPDIPTPMLNTSIV